MRNMLFGDGHASCVTEDIVATNDIWVSIKRILVVSPDHLFASSPAAGSEYQGKRLEHLLQRDLIGVDDTDDRHRLARAH